MKKKIMLFLFMMLVPILGVKADTIKKIDMRINILEDGSAEIKEIWNVKASSGSEWYKQMYNLGGMELSNYKVLMDGKELTYKTWNVNENLSQKAGYYGINYVSEGIELCFGKSDMKEHTFTLTYNLSNFVFNTEDSQVVYVTLFPEVTMQNFTVEVSSYYEFPDTLDVWGYGYKGYAYVENGLIKMSNEGELSNDYVVLLAKFPLNTFKTDYTVEDYNTFDDVYNKSEDGSFDYDYSYKKTFWDYVIIIFNIIICGIFPLLIVVFAIKAVFDSGYGYINNKKIDKKNTQMFRDIPCNKDIYYANALISLNKNIFTYKESNILGAILLKWIRNDKVRLTNQTKGIFNKETSVIDLTMNPTFDNENEEKLFKMMYKASGDGILEAKELEKWLKIVIIAVALCGLVVCAVAIPWIGHVLIASDPQISDMYIPWLVLFIISAIPCYVILYLGWRVAVNIGKDRSFSLENARHIKLASKIILFDALYFFVVNICMWRIYVNHPGVILALVFIVFACVVASVVAAVLSHLVVKAADLQEQSDLTI